MEIHDKCSLHEVDSDETQILMYQTPSFSMPLLFRFTVHQIWMENGEAFFKQHTNE